MEIGIVGAGLMGTRLALHAAARGCAVTLVGRDAERVRAALAAAAAELRRDPAPIAIATELRALAGVALVAETIPEDLASKRALIAALDEVLDPHVPIASGTSSLPPDALGAGSAHPGRVLVAHMVHPVTLVPIVEVVVPRDADPRAVATLDRWIAELEMRAVRLRAPVTGFIVNRLQFALLREAAQLVERGIADAADVDAVVEAALGPRWSATGPLASAELGGRETWAAIARLVLPTLDDRPSIPLLEEDGPVRGWGEAEKAAARARRDRVYAAISEAAR